jgi:hypothetical protein
MRSQAGQQLFLQSLALFALLMLFLFFSLAFLSLQKLFFLASKMLY